MFGTTTSAVVHSKAVVMLMFVELFIIVPIVCWAFVRRERR